MCIFQINGGSFVSNTSQQAKLGSVISSLCTVKRIRSSFHAFRKAMNSIVNHNIFEYFIIFVVLSSSVLLVSALLNPIYDGGALKVNLFVHREVISVYLSLFFRQFLENQKFVQVENP